MKLRLITSSVAVLIATLETDFAQSTFQNLDFEGANIQPGQTSGSIPLADALPGWAFSLGTNSYPNVGYDVATLDGSSVSILDSKAWPGSVIDGNYTVLLEAGWGPIVYNDPPNLRPADTSIFQSGLVPAGSLSLLFKAYGPTDRLAVSVGGQSLPLANLGNGFYGADIHQWAGQTAELKFTAVANNPYVGNLVNIGLDDIQFSPSTIPEPGVTVLAGLGIVLMSLRCVGRRKAPEG
jgi:hypothetical protein